jgi:hypothetical protein
LSELQAAEKVGEVMIFDIAQMVVEYLLAHNHVLNEEIIAFCGVVVG